MKNDFLNGYIEGINAVIRKRYDERTDERLKQLQEDAKKIHELLSTLTKPE